MSDGSRGVVVAVPLGVEVASRAGLGVQSHPNSAGHLGEGKGEHAQPRREQLAVGGHEFPPGFKVTEFLTGFKVTEFPGAVTVKGETMRGGRVAEMSTHSIQRCDWPTWRGSASTGPVGV